MNFRIFIVWFYLCYFPVFALGELNNPVSQAMIKGIAKYAGSHYQSCKALLNPDTPFLEIINKWHSKDPYIDTSICTDRRKANFDYRKYGNLKLREGEVDSFQRVWCSGTIAGAMSASGMRFHTRQSGHISPVTSQIHETVFEKKGGRGAIFQTKDTSCFSVPKITADESLHPGDLINTSSNHIIMIYQVGDDPLGLKKVRNAEDCINISKEDFNFTFFNSTSLGEQNGNHFVKASEAHPDSDCINHLVLAAREACQDQFAELNRGGITLPVKSYGDGYKGGKTYFSHLRHFGDSKKGCVGNPHKLRGEHCLKDECYSAVEKLVFDPHKNRTPVIGESSPVQTPSTVR